MPLVDGRTYLVKNTGTGYFVINRQPLHDNPEAYAKVFAKKWKHDEDIARIQVSVHEERNYSFRVDNYFISECDLITSEGRRNEVWKEERYYWSLEDARTGDANTFYIYVEDALSGQRFVSTDAGGVVPIDPTEGGPIEPNCNTTPPCHHCKPLFTFGSKTNESIWQFTEVQSEQLP